MEPEGIKKDKNLFGYPEGTTQVYADLRTSKTHTIDAIKVVKFIILLQEWN